MSGRDASQFENTHCDTQHDKVSHKITNNYFVPQYVKVNNQITQ